MRTFVVRIRTDGAEEELCGVVDDVTTGERVVFQVAEQLLAVLASGAHPRPD
jgi:hypothetical protein